MMISTQGFRTSWAIDQHFKNLTVTTASLSLLVNYPHFLVSYKLAYTRGRDFITGNWWQLIVVPLGLVGLFALAFFFYDTPVTSLPAVTTLTGTLTPWGGNARVLSGPRLGDLLFTLAFNVMIFTVGWHYTKQVFGCMMVQGSFDGYRMSPAQRQLTKRALLSIWGMNFVYSNIAGSQNSFSQFTYYSFDFPDIAGPISQLAVFGGLILVVHRVFYANYRATGQAPSANLLAPFVALYIWWLPQTRQYEFYFLLTPLFHSLQYLAFVYKMEDARIRTLPHPELRATAVVAGLVLAGWLAFEFVPNSLDNALGTFNAWKMFFFFTAAMLFINIHHYFIDNVLWRFKDPQVRVYLLS
ncbi:MAG: hypothetical protein FJW14_05285 [Acidimicrobiia bacterium]|nr:hypothetical protein [Acidimicrobiia bacterium]